MKKIKYFLICLLLVCLGANCFGFVGKTEVSASTQNGPYQNSYMAHYFYNLTKNFSNNYHGSCGYVAIGMVLSYYDNYLNANIIPEAYEATVTSSDGDFVVANNSPGVKVAYHIADSNYDSLNINHQLVRNDTVKNYYEDMLALANCNIQAKMFDRAQDMLIMPNNLNNFNDESAGLTFAGLKRVFGSYMLSVGVSQVSTDEEFVENTYQMESCQRSFDTWENRNINTKQFVLEQLQLGKPVLLVVQRYDQLEDEKKGHVIIAYDYDDNGEIYCHAGWHDGGGAINHVTPLEIGYTHWHSAFAVDINLPHVCDNNYIVNGVGYCYHNIEVNTYNHTHTFIDTAENWITNSEDGNLYVKCETCPETRLHTHSYDSYWAFKNNRHRAICDCGDYKTEMHVVRSTDLTRCFLCGGLVDGDHIIIWANRPLQYSVNGSYIRADGIIVLVDEDIEAYLNGTLEFYPQNSEIV